MIHTLEWTVGMVHFPVMLEINENEKMPCDGKEVMAANIEKSKLLLSPQQNDSDALKMMFIDPILQANWNGE